VQGTGGEIHAGRAGELAAEANGQNIAPGTLVMLDPLI
jgi:hypothetical protein